VGVAMAARAEAAKGEADRPIGTRSTVTIGLISGVAAGLLQLVGLAFYAGRQIEAARAETMKEIAANYVSKEVSETRWSWSSTNLNSELTTIRRDLAEVRSIAQEIPKISAKLETLTQK
jgi:hypothetical protein